MDNNTLNKISVAISALFLILLMVRMAYYGSAYGSTPEGQLFVTALNIFLIVGLVLMVIFVGMRAYRYVAAKTMKETHCQQCYAKLPPGAEFCPKCGWCKPGYEQKDDTRKEY